MDLATFWAIFRKTHLINLLPMFCKSEAKDLKSQFVCLLGRRMLSRTKNPRKFGQKTLERVSASLIIPQKFLGLVLVAVNWL
jgi:hypothetical protein